MLHAFVLLTDRTRKVFAHDDVLNNQQVGRRQQPQMPVNPDGGRHHFSNAIFVAPSRRRGPARRLPETPKQPSMLDIDGLADKTNLATKGRDLLGADLFSFPRLETSPTRMKVLFQNVKGRWAADNIPSTIQERPNKRTLPPPREALGPKWSRMTFEEAIIAGRGSRQLPVIGPQQLLQCSAAGRWGQRSFPRRELPRPGAKVDLAMMTNGGYGNNVRSEAVYMAGESDEEEDWC